MKRRDFLIASAGLSGSILSGRLHAQNRPCPPPSLNVQGGTSAASTCSFDAASDWAARSTGPGVVWAHDFRTDAEVNAFRWSGGYGNDPKDVAAPGLVRRVATDGITGGCLEVRGTPGSYHWWRPFSPLESTAYGFTDHADGGKMKRLPWNPSDRSNTTNTWYSGNYAHADYAGISSVKDGTDYWLQFRVKFDPNRTRHGVGKAFYLSRTELSLTAQEINGIAGNTAFDMYTGGRWLLNGATEPASPVVLSGEYSNRSEYGGPNWSWPFDEWGTFLIHVIPGHENDNYNGNNLDTGIEVWAAARGQTSYTKIWSRSNYRFDFQNAQGYANGWNALILTAYNNGAGGDFWVRYCQVIFKKGGGSGFGSNPETDGIQCPRV